MGLQQDLGRQIRRHRERKKLSQVDLSDAIGRSVQMIGRIERGESAPSFDTLEAICRALDTSVFELFAPRSLTEGDAAALRIAERLSGLDPRTLVWIDELLALALSHPVGRPAHEARSKRSGRS